MTARPDPGFDRRKDAAAGLAATGFARRAAFGLLAADAMGLVLCFNAAFWLRLGDPPGLTASMGIPLVLLWLSLYVLDGYGLERQVSGMRPPARAVVGVAVAAVLTAAAAYGGGLWSVDPTFGRGIFPVAFVAQAAWSAGWRLLLGGWIRRQAERIRWLVVGSGDAASRLRAEFESAQSQGELLFLAERAGEGDHPGLPLAGTLEDLERVAQGPLAGIVVALQGPVPEPLMQRLISLRLSGMRVYGLVDFYEQLWFKVPVLHTRDGWLLFAEGFDLLHNPLGLRVKRVLDVVFALSLLVVASPFMLLAAMAIRLDSRGPVIYRQARTGLDGREFEILKFRSMAHDAERDGPQWSQRSDPRVTRVGRLLRITRVDELPQLVNVLKGEMSFIGPRPERPVFNAMLEKQIPMYNVRHLVRPGITGWAQVMYPYGASVEDAREKLAYDIYYIKNYSVLLDVGILFKTLRVVILGKGR